MRKLNGHILGDDDGDDDDDRTFIMMKHDECEKVIETLKTMSI